MSAFLRRIDLEDHLLEKRESLHQQEKNTLLRPYIVHLRGAFLKHRETLVQSSRFWFISSTARGGGVAEMLPRIMALMREMGMFVEWLVLDVKDSGRKAAFFSLTKAIHNGVHGEGVPLDEWEQGTAAGLHGEGKGQRTDRSLEARLRPHRDLLESVCTDAAAAFFRDFLGVIDGGADPCRDVVMVHDPQPLAMVAALKARMPGLMVIWRCHIGLDVTNSSTSAAWALLRPYVELYDFCVFSAPEYIPPWLDSGRAGCVAPGIAPSAPKNKEMSPFEVAQTLMRAGIMDAPQAHMCTLIEPAFEHRATMFTHPSQQQRVPPPPPSSPPARRGGGGGGSGRGRSRSPSPMRAHRHTTTGGAAKSAAVLGGAHHGLPSDAPDSSQHSQHSSLIHQASSPQLGVLGQGHVSRASSASSMHIRTRRLPRFSIPDLLYSPMGRWGGSGWGQECSSPGPLSENGVPMLHRPVITQISRWDRLKGWLSLLRGFVSLKADPERWVRALVLGEGPLRASVGGSARAEVADSVCAGCLSPEADKSYSVDRHLALIRNACLLLAGPDPAFIADDPEGKEVLAELKAEYDALPGHLAADVRICLLPMDNPVENALMVNALQRASFVVVQNSLREGFGLTATEAMYKRTPFIGTAQAVGLRTQVRHGIDGVLVQGDPSVPDNVATALNLMLGDALLREEVAVNGQRTAVERFLIFAQLNSWMEIVLRLKRQRERAAALATGSVDEVANRGGGGGGGWPAGVIGLDLSAGAAPPVSPLHPPTGGGELRVKVDTALPLLPGMTPVGEGAPPSAPAAPSAALQRHHNESLLLPEAPPAEGGQLRQPTGAASGEGFDE